ncbi:MAG: hypothetical protein V7642_1384 [Burkholderiales bacterium]|jgi:hypothetical protein
MKTSVTEASAASAAKPRPAREAEITNAWYFSLRI